MRPIEHHFLTNDEILTEASAFFTRARNVPYIMGLDGDPLKLFTENRGNCTRKHAYLSHELQGLGYQIQYGVALFDWRDLPIPYELLSLLKDPLDTHLFIYVSRDGREVTVDATWDPEMPVGFPSNSWDGQNSTPIAVPPLRVTRIHPRLLEARALISSTLGQLKRKVIPSSTPFNDAMNSWFNRE